VGERRYDTNYDMFDERVITLKCPEEISEYMHEYLDEDISADREKLLRVHLRSCSECTSYFHELKRAIALVQSTSHIKAPVNFTANVLDKLPKEKKKIGFQRWMQQHPLMTAASIFILLMTGSLFSTWEKDHEFSVSKQPNLVIQNNTVIVPAGEVVKGDIVVRNGELRVEGEVQGDVTVINGEQFVASAGHVTGEIEEVNAVFEWIWYKMKNVAAELFFVYGSLVG
jgi:anti-sigma factor RsiW